MSLSLDRCTALLGEPNVRAFLHVIRHGETNQSEAAYRMMYGGGLFDAPPWRHPWFGLPTTQGAKASGAYQFLGTTWAEVAVALRLDDFSPAAQDVGAVYLMDRRGAIPAVLAGDVETACLKLRDEWVALKTMPTTAARSVFAAYGGKLDAQNGVGAPQTEPGIPTQPDASPIPPAAHSGPIPSNQPVGGTMGPALFLPAILQMIPGLVAAFGKGERAAQQAQAAQVVVDAFTKAVPGALNAQDAVEKAQASPAIAAQAKAAVLADPAVLGLVEVGGGVTGARAANLQLLQSAQHWWQLVLNPVLLVTLITLPLVYIIIIRLSAYLDKVSPDVIAQSIGTVIGLVLGSIMGFWMGQTWQQNTRRQTDSNAGP